MNATTTMTIRVSTELKDKLGRIAEATRRSQSFLAAEALEAYARRELQIIEDIRVGLEEIAAGKGIPHDVVMTEARALIAAVKKRAA